MKAEELRIGNYVRYLGGDTTVNVVSNGFISTLKSGAIAVGQADPIPIDEEWLMNLGFTINSFDGNRFDDPKNGGNRYHIMPYKFDYVFRCAGASLVEIKYIHQLQNLYFALTGEELVINNGI